MTSIAQQSDQTRHISARITQARLDRGISQSEAAAGLGWFQSRIGKLENGTRRLLFSEACQLANYYDVQLASFEPGTPMTEEAPWWQIRGHRDESVETFMKLVGLTVEWEGAALSGGEGDGIEVFYPTFVCDRRRFAPRIGHQERDDVEAFRSTAEDVVVAEQRPSVEHWRLGGFGGSDPDAPTAEEMHHDSRQLRRQMRGLLGPEAYLRLIERVQVLGYDAPAD